MGLVVVAQEACERSDSNEPDRPTLSRDESTADSPTDQELSVHEHDHPPSASPSFQEQELALALRQIETILLKQVQSGTRNLEAHFARAERELSESLNTPAIATMIGDALKDDPSFDVVPWSKTVQRPLSDQQARALVHTLASIAKTTHEVLIQLSLEFSDLDNTLHEQLRNIESTFREGWRDRSVGYAALNDLELLITAVENRQVRVSLMTKLQAVRDRWNEEWSESDAALMTQFFKLETQLIEQIAHSRQSALTNASDALMKHTFGEQD